MDSRVSSSEITSSNGRSFRLIRWQSRDSPSIVSVTDLRVVIEENTDRLIGQLEAQPVLIRVIDPLGDEKRHDILHGRRVARVVALHLRHAGL